MKTSQELFTAYIGIVQKKISMPALKMVLSGIFAGIFIGLGGLGSQIASTAIEGGFGRFIGACIFSVGLFMVVTVGVELFTGNCMMVIPWFAGEQVFFKGIFKNWVFVYIGNFIGGLLLALAIYYSDLGSLFNGGLAKTAVSMSVAKVDLSPVEAIIRGILCNFLVCLAVWIAMQAQTVGAKAIAVLAPVMLFVLCGFEHSVANMYFIPLGIMFNPVIGVGDFLLYNLLPVTLGNIIGGSVIVGGGLRVLARPTD